MDIISIRDLEARFRVGVSAVERDQPQRLLLTVEMAHSVVKAAASDDLGETIDYHAVVNRLLAFGNGREWKLIERLASDVAEVILAEFRPESVTVEVKKFVLPQTRHVSVRVSRTLGTAVPE